MTIQIDSREKSKAIQRILKEFSSQGVKHYTSKLFVGDYMNLDTPRLIIDRKQNLSELCANVCQEHKRFRDELIRAKENGIRLVILCEHGKGIQTLEDVIWWTNPRRFERIRDRATGKWKTIETKAMNGDVLYKILSTMQEKYGVLFLFCGKEDTGKEIIRILSNDERRD